MSATIGKIVCTESMRDEIERIAEAAGVSRATVIRMAVRIGLPDVAARLTQPARTSPER